MQKSSDGKYDLETLVQNFDDLTKEINRFPDPFYSQSNILEVTFTGGTLDQTLPHKLKSKHLYWTPIRVVSTGVVRFREQPPVNSKLLDTHIRLISDGACSATFLVMR